MTEDPRKTGLKNGLRQLEPDQLRRVLDYHGEMVLDTYNYENGNFCPLAVAIGLDSMPDPTHEKVFGELERRGYKVYNTRGIAGEFYTSDRKVDLITAAQEVLEEKTMYVAAVLNQASVEALKAGVREVLLDAICVDIFEEFKFQTPVGGPLPHHMTINMGDFDSSLNDPAIMGAKVEVRTSYVYYDPELGVCAVAVEECRGELNPEDYSSQFEVESSNNQPHITVALKPGVKPKMSNELFGQRKSTTVKLELGLVLDAVITLCD